MSDDADRTETILSEHADQPTPPPRILGDRYLLEERIARGGMASVWRAHDEKLARTVAVKILHEHLSADAAFRERFRREAIAAAKLSHPSIVGVYDTGTDGDRAWLVMEFVDGVTLKDVIGGAGALEPAEVAAIGERTARALDYAHSRGLVHRDVKPANILMGDDGLVKIADFGIAKADEASSELTKTGMVLGTAAYVAPEQILAERLDGRADQYGLACVLYEALTGEQPFRADSAVATAAQRLETAPLPVRSRRADVPRGLDEVIMRAMAREPDDRYPTSGAFADALAAWSADGPEHTAALGHTGEVNGQRGRQGQLQPPPAAPPEEDDPRSRARRPVESGQTQVVRASGGARTRRSGSGWLGVALLSVVAVVAILAVGLAIGVIDAPSIGTPGVEEPGADPDATGGVGEDEPAEAEPIALDPTQLSTLDPPDPPTGQPGGDGSENPDVLQAMIDGEAATFWRTDLYQGADFGNLKSGVGVVVDLGAERQVTGLTVQTPTPEMRFQVYLVNEAADQLSGWGDPVTEVTDAAESQRIGFEEPAAARYLLIWITTPLPEFEGRNAAAISELTVRGLPQ